MTDIRITHLVGNILRSQLCKGDVLAQKLFAKCYTGLFFVEEDEKFVYWMRKAAEQKDPEAQRILGEVKICLK